VSIIGNSMARSELRSAQASAAAAEGDPQRLGPRHSGPVCSAGRTTNLDVIDAVVGWLEAGHGCWLATVVENTPGMACPPGTLLGISDAAEKDDGQICNLEAELLQRSCTGASGQNWPQLIEHTVVADEQAKYCLAGPGRTVLVIERHEAAGSLEHFRGLQEGLGRRERLIRRVDRVSGSASIEQPRPMALVELDAAALWHKLDPTTRLTIVGAGEIARVLALFASACGLDVTLVEPRQAFARCWGETGVKLEQRDPADALASGLADACSAVVVLTDAPELEHPALVTALQSSAFYIGALGTRQSAALRRQRLFEAGVGKNQLPRLHSPIGFEIGSETPAEIAAAIMAQLLAERHRLMRRAVSL